jgi:LysM repeat protein
MPMPGRHVTVPFATVPFAVAACVGTAALGAPAHAYTVAPGDTVSHIAVRTGTSVREIVAVNGLGPRARIRIGQVLTIPREPAPAPPPATTYTVRPGDTVLGIAARSGSTAAAIAAANGLDRRGFIRVGQVLTLPPAGPAGSPATASATGPSTAATTPYTVRSGDTLTHIAARSGTTLAALRTANPGLDAAGRILAGQVLRVPVPRAPMPNTFAGRTYPEAVVRAATANRDALAARAVPSRAQMQRIVAETARHWGVDPALAQAVAYLESGFNMRAVSPANAVGTMQVIPSSGAWASDIAGRRLDLLDPVDNATAGVVILRSLTRMEADLPTAVAGYYQGLASVRRNGMYDDTRQYVANVQALTGRFR